MGSVCGLGAERSFGLAVEIVGFSVFGTGILRAECLGECLVCPQWLEGYARVMLLVELLDLLLEISREQSVDLEIVKTVSVAGRTCPGC